MPARVTYFGPPGTFTFNEQFNYNSIQNIDVPAGASLNTFFARTVDAGGALEIDADQEPAGTVKVAGTLTAGESLERLRTIPPSGVGPCRFAQAIAWVPPLTAAGVT